MLVDPENRLVADSLEAEWNAKLRAAAETKLDYERQCAIECTQTGLGGAV